MNFPLLFKKETSLSHTVSQFPMIPMISMSLWTPCASISSVDPICYEKVIYNKVLLLFIDLLVQQCLSMRSAG